MMSILRIIFGIILLPLVFGTARSFFIQLESFVNPAINISKSQFIFLSGFVSYLIFQAVFFKPIRTYIWGHELTHKLSAILCQKKTGKIKVDKNGGSVPISETNFFINLAPYFLPLYTIIALLIFYIIKIFVDLTAYYNYLFFILGFTLSLHIFLTIYALSSEQSDIKKTGIILSFDIIILFNILVILGLLKFVFPEKIFIKSFFEQTLLYTTESYNWIWVKVLNVRSRL